MDASRSIRSEAAYLRRASVRFPVMARTIVRRGAERLKKQLQAEASGVEHAPGLPAAMSYETSMTPTAIGFEVGPRAGGAGSLALLYFGNSKTPAQLPDPAFALRREALVLDAELDAWLERNA